MQGQDWLLCTAAAITAFLRGWVLYFTRPTTFYRCNSGRCHLVFLMHMQQISCLPLCRNPEIFSPPPLKLLVSCWLWYG